MVETTNYKWSLMRTFLQNSIGNTAGAAQRYILRALSKSGMEKKTWCCWQTKASHTHTHTSGAPKSGDLVSQNLSTIHTPCAVENPRRLALHDESAVDRLPHLQHQLGRKLSNNPQKFLPIPICCKGKTSLHQIDW